MKALQHTFLMIGNHVVSILRSVRATAATATWLAPARFKTLAQALAVAYAALAGILFLVGGRPASSLYWLYALLPIAIGFVAVIVWLVVR